MSIKRDALFSSKSDEWATPQWLFDKLNNEFHFTLDPCATAENAKCQKYYTKADNGLTQEWNNETVFCNPPYGRSAVAWIKKCYLHSIKRGGGTAVMLIPARTDTRAFHEYIYGKAEVRFIKGRLKFGNAKNNAPFPSMVVIFRKNSVAEDNEQMFADDNEQLESGGFCGSGWDV